MIQVFYCVCKLKRRDRHDQAENYLDLPYHHVRFASHGSLFRRCSSDHIIRRYVAEYFIGELVDDNDRNIHPTTINNDIQEYQPDDADDSVR